MEEMCGGPGSLPAASELPLVAASLASCLVLATQGGGWVGVVFKLEGWGGVLRLRVLGLRVFMEGLCID